MNCSLIQPKLWIGPDPRLDEDFRYLKALQITAILSLQDHEDRGLEGIQSEREAARRVAIAFHNVPVRDFSRADLQRRLPDCVTMLELLTGEGHSVYVHCTAGVNRSPTVVAAYLHWCAQWPLDRALAHIMECRPCGPDDEAICNAKWYRPSE